MEIKNALLQNVDPYRTTKLDPKTDSARARSAADAPSPQGDRVSLSTSAVLHTVAHSVAVKTPEVRQEKIDAVKERVAAGRYTIDAKNIAEKLLQSDALLADTLTE